MHTITDKISLRGLVLFAAVLTIQLGMSTRTAQAQRWLQTVQVIVPIGEDDIAGTLLDTLVHVFEENNLRLARTPDGVPRPFAEIENSLLDQGVDFTSANQVFISYRFAADQRGMTANIENMYFIYRPTDFEDEDIPLFYLDTSDAAIKSVLISKGTSLPNNEAVFLPFWDQLMLHRLPESTLTVVGNRVIREPDVAEAEKRKLLATIRKFVY